MTLKDFNLLCDNGCKQKIAGQMTLFILTQEYLLPNLPVLRKPFFSTFPFVSPPPLSFPLPFKHFLGPCLVSDYVVGTEHTKMAKNSLAKETNLL